MQLDGLRHLVLVDAKAPVSFFAYPGKAERPGARRLRGARPGRGRPTTRSARSKRWPTRVGATGRRRAPQAADRPDRPAGALTAETIAAAIGALLPEGAIVADEGNTTGLFVTGPPRARRRTTGST